MQTTVLFTLSVGLISLFIFTLLRSQASGLGQIPNAHFTVPFTRLWIVWIRWRSTENRTRLYLHRQLGPIVRIGPREVSVNCVDDGTRILYSGKFAKEARLYRALIDDAPFLFIMVDNDDHKKRKKMLASVYTKSFILNSSLLDKMISLVSSRLREEIEQWVNAKASVEVFSRTKAYSFDIIVGWLYGAENNVDTLRNEDLRNYFSDAIATRFAGFFWRFEFDWLITALRALGITTMSLSPHLADARFKGWIKSMNAKAYTAREAQSSSTANLHDHLYDQVKDAGPNLSHGDIDTLVAVELDDHLIAGFEPMGIAMTYALYELSQHPDRQRRLREELLTLSQPADRSMTLRIEELPFLNAVVNETLRVHSPVPGSQPRVVPEPGCRVAGRFDVPPGTVVSSASSALHFSADVFPSPSEWRPERWLEADESTLIEMRKWMWAFASGSRMCIGMHLALRVFKELLVTIYSEYQTSVDKNFTGNMEQGDGLIAGPIANRLDLKFYRRGELEIGL